MSERTPTSPETRKNFLSEIIDEDLSSGTIKKLITRFPPEPNGFLHIGHAKAISVNFGLASQFGGQCHLRFDDTNPETEEQVYIDSIQQDIKWLGFDWGEKLFYASSYFEQLYNYAVYLIKGEKAFVCSQSVDEARATRGSLTEPGTASPDRNRPIEESLKLFEQMRNGAFKDGEFTVRAKIDMSNANMKMRDPLLYRIRHATHPKTGQTWCIYPMYDFAHCLSDSIEGITHSICTLEFENNRELYDWILNACDVEHVSRQYEMARLQITYIMTSKRKLKSLVDDGHVAGWDDPRMPTIAGLRRRGVPPQTIRNFCEDIGVTKANTTLDMSRFDFHLRQSLNHMSPRVMAVIDPLKVIITNFDEHKEPDWLNASYWPHDIPKEGSRKIPFTRELFIERSDFSLNPPKGFYRLRPGGEVRLRYGYFIKCEDVITDESGAVTELHCTYDVKTVGGQSTDGRKVKGTIHWVSASHSVRAEFRRYTNLFEAEHVGARTGHVEDDLAKQSIQVHMGRIEPSVTSDDAETRYQFERNGYFWRDQKDSSDQLVFNEIIGLRDSWTRTEVKKPDVKPKPAPVSKKTDKGPRPTKRTPAQLRNLKRREIPALMHDFERYQAEVGLTEHDADVITGSEVLNALFGSALETSMDSKVLTKWFTNVLPALLEPLSESPAVDGAVLADVIGLIEQKIISSTSGKEVAIELLTEGGSAEEVVARLNLAQVSDEASIMEVVKALLTANPDKVAAIEAGRTQLAGFFIGQVMRTMPNANPQVVQQLVKARFKL
jgi:glutaminyl-tRNA synthetase